ncbi:DUF389 domain-containing protein [Streptomyces polyrhachis]|uniref:DUF389 domain-containing protein n=1 Tax=Streptomyces polyrhachis TaxID=1282885 RepID=A0ABW2GMT5_9ACTN
MQLRVVCESQQSPAVLKLLDTHPGVAHLTYAEGIGKRPVGDVIEAVVPRAAAEQLMNDLAGHGVARTGEVSLRPIGALISDSADDARRAAQDDADDDAVIWDELVATTGEESQLGTVYLSFLTIACLLSAVGVITDSSITLVGAMVVSPDFGPLAALAVAVVGRQRTLAVKALLALGVGFPLAMLVTFVLAEIAKAAGLYDPGDLGHLQQVAFIYQVGPFSLIVALLAGAAGMLALTSEKQGPLIGVFISVTTVPAAGFAVLAAVGRDWHRCGESLLQLLINFAGVTAAGVLTLLLRRRHIIRPGQTGAGAVAAPQRSSQRSS